MAVIEAGMRLQPETLSAYLCQFGLIGDGAESAISVVDQRREGPASSPLGIRQRFGGIRNIKRSAPGFGVPQSQPVTVRAFAILD